MSFINFTRDGSLSLMTAGFCLGMSTGAALGGLWWAAALNLALAAFNGAFAALWRKGVFQ